MVLYALYVCLLHSHFPENHLIHLQSMDPSFLRWFCHMGSLGSEVIYCQTRQDVTKGTHACLTVGTQCHDHSDIG
jgi:hypothetical protein